jgi:hypothetical protein
VKQVPAVEEVELSHDRRAGDAPRTGGRPRRR